MNFSAQASIIDGSTMKLNTIPDKDSFCAYAAAHRIIPIIIKQKADTITPISVFQRLRTDGPCFLLESAEGNEKQARYSIIGRYQLMSFKSKGDKTSVIIDGRSMTGEYSNNPITAIRELLDRYKIPDALAADGYRCGLTGYFAYDFIRQIESVPDNNTDETNLPDCDLIAPRQVVVYDHLRHEMTIICNVLITEGADHETLIDCYDQAISELLDIRQLISGSYTPESAAEYKISAASFSSNMSKEEYMAIVERARRYIHAGDIFQAVLSQRFSTAYGGDAFEIYRSLRNVSPSPYLFFLQLDDVCLAGASPEMLVRLNSGLVETSPIAGTRRRGRDEQEDLQLAAELLADTKEMSEHAMLTDLARNDIGRICSFGSVKVSEYANVELFSHVMHIVSKVEGHLAADKSAIDVLCALLPAGTLSGAPKIRAMEIIDELETVRRGPYGGAAGYLSFDGSMNTCITIRTALISKGQLHIQSGAGIVADSKPESEYYECVNKAAAMIAAIEQAGNFL